VNLAELVHPEHLTTDGLATLLAPPSWHRDAACREYVGLVEFFPERGVSAEPAKAVCAGCLVREECLEYALALGEKFGIWGGTSERERRALRRGREGTTPKRRRGGRNVVTDAA
jgi:WhiB family redox-sensing transcriptional regulator